MVCNPDRADFNNATCGEPEDMDCPLQYSAAEEWGFETVLVGFRLTSAFSEQSEHCISDLLGPWGTK